MQPATILLVPELAHQMGLIPLVWLVLLHFRGKPRDVAFWWIAAGFAVSWLADTASHWTGHLFVSLTYPFLQSVFVAWVFITRRNAGILIAVLMVTGLAAIVWQFFITGWPVDRISARDGLLHTVAWLSVAGIVLDRLELGRLRLAILVYFGLGWLAWIAYTIEPAWGTWGCYQLTRLAGIVLFCWASMDPRPQFKLTSTKRMRLSPSR